VLERSPRSVELSLRRVVLSLRGVELSLRGVVLSLRGVVLSLRGVVLSLRGVERFLNWEVEGRSVAPSTPMIGGPWRPSLVLSRPTNLFSRKSLVMNHLASLFSRNVRPLVGSSPLLERIDRSTYGIL
jgi:hypothetical protein